ncbi:unnamed protein product [Onchocerca ochengi]|uniref:Ntox44 domain-containing protein n=1 Tax=Onchocerca ochengi TaxID=42157 RepID=A0A182E6K4_ONCOC|nr:unnamed protein product [Onchocerca ochengi]
MASFGFYIGQRAYFAGFFSNSVTAEIMTATSTYTFYLHKNTVEFNNITKTIEKGLYGNDILDRLGSISLVNVGEALVREMGWTDNENYPFRYNKQQKIFQFRT